MDLIIYINLILFTKIWYLSHMLSVSAELTLRLTDGQTFTSLQSSNKILVDSRGDAKITDFGLSRVLKQAMANSSGEGALAYKDPISFKNTSYQLGKKSDIFSLGVILWEITSGKVPCGGRTEAVDIIAYRLQGFRDSPLSETPGEYINLYSECWHEDPDSRPTCESVYTKLKKPCDYLDYSTNC